ncbi:hypothetical protein IKP85_03090 [bacterium]|nr:hypothetical protein [bacterium]
MEEYKRQMILLGIFLILLGFCIILYKSDRFWDLSKGFPLHTNSGNCIKISDDICLAEDAGLRLSYYEASSLCSKRGMKLPSKEDAWTIWINSENCHRIFASNLDVPKNKEAFTSVCNSEDCIEQAINVKKYCSPEFLIKFPIASQYEKGSFWLRDNAGNDKHYAINYSTGVIRAFDSNTKTLGVRCISK